MAAIEAPAEKQGEYDSSRYAPCDAPVTPRQYPRLYEQEPTSGEGGERVNVSSRETSKPGRIVCPVCGSGELRFREPTLLQFRSSALVDCDSCGHNVDEAVLRVLEQIVALPDAIGDLRMRPP